MPGSLRHHPERLAKLHRAYVDMAVTAQVTEDRRRIFFEEGTALMARGAEAILLGGTDFALAVDGHDPGFPTIDSAELHLDAIMNWVRANAT